MFAAVACLALYFAFLFIQTRWHRDYFVTVGYAEDGNDGIGVPSGRMALASFGLMVVSLLSVVLLAKGLAPAIEEGVGSWARRRRSWA